MVGCVAGSLRAVLQTSPCCWPCPKPCHSRSPVTYTLSLSCCGRLVAVASALGLAGRVSAAVDADGVAAPVRSSPDRLLSGACFAFTFLRMLRRCSIDLGAMPALLRGFCMRGRGSNKADVCYGTQPRLQRHRSVLLWCRCYCMHAVASPAVCVGLVLVGAWPGQRSHCGWLHPSGRKNPGCWGVGGGARKPAQRGTKGRLNTCCSGSCKKKTGLLAAWPKGRPCPCPSARQPPPIAHASCADAYRHTDWTCSMTILHSKPASASPCPLRLT